MGSNADAHQQICDLSMLGQWVVILGFWLLVIGSYLYFPRKACRKINICARVPSAKQVKSEETILPGLLNIFHSYTLEFDQLDLVQGLSRIINLDTLFWFVIDKLYLVWPILSTSPSLHCYADISVVCISNINKLHILSLYLIEIIYQYGRSFLSYPAQK
jgi:hypothetical protein